MGQTLVLDCGYSVIGVSSWESAIVWILEHIAEVVEEHPDKFIRTVNWSIKMPSVVRLIKPIKRKRAIKFSRYGVYGRDRGKCQYCGARVSRDEFTYDHVIPRAQGGRTEWTNVVVCCVRDNQKKAGRTPEQAGMKLLSTPVKPKSLPDFPRQLQFRRGMPDSWKNYIRDAVYWESELDE